MAGLQIRLCGPYFRQFLSRSPTTGRRIGENLSSHSRIFASTPKARQAARVEQFAAHRGGRGAGSGWRRIPCRGMCKTTSLTSLPPQKRYAPLGDEPSSTPTSRPGAGQAWAIEAAFQWPPVQVFLMGTCRSCRSHGAISRLRRLACKTNLVAGFLRIEGYTRIGCNRHSSRSHSDNPTPAHQAWRTRQS